MKKFGLNINPQQSEQIYIGLDIGSTKVTCIVGLHEDGTAKPSVIGVGVAPTTGMRKGVVVDVDETVSSITAAVDEAERISGIAIDRATISIDGAHVASLNSKGVIAVGRVDNEISVEDLERVGEAATAIQLPPNREILQVFARSYSVDSQSNIKDPVGMNGVRLEVESHIITGGTPAIRNLDRSIYQAGVDIQGRVLVPLAAARAVLTKRQKELGVAVIDIGGGTTGIAVYEEGDVLYSSVLPVGAGHITNDIAIGLKTDLDTAEKLKIKYVKASNGRNNLDEKIRISDQDGDGGVVTRRQIQHIAEARLDEIFQLIKAELKKINKDRMLPAGIVLTGGGAKMAGIDELARNILQLPAVVGKPEGFTGIVDRINDPAFAAPIGLMLENMSHSAFAAQPNQGIGQTVDQIKGIFKRFMP